MTQNYFYFNSLLYLLLGSWCTIAPQRMAARMGYLTMSKRGRSEYLVIYGGLQIGLAITFFLLARNPTYFHLGLLISIGLYAPIVILRFFTGLMNRLSSGWTLGTVALETLLLIVACCLYRSNVTQTAR